MKIPFTAATPALTRAQIDAIVSSGAIHPDSPSRIWQWDSIRQSEGPLQQREVACTHEEVTRGAQTSVRTAALAAAAYGCVDWYLYPESHGDADSQGDAESASEAA